MTDETTFGEIRIAKTHGGQHGTDRAYAVPELAERLGGPVAWCCVILMRRRSTCRGYLPSGVTRWRLICKSTSRTVVLNAGYAHVIGLGHYYGAGRCLTFIFLLPQANIVAKP